MHSWVWAAVLVAQPPTRSWFSDRRDHD